MAEIVVRPFEEADREGFNRIRSMTYRGGKPVLEHEDLLGPGCLGYVGEVNGRIEGAYTALEMTATRGEATFRCAGVCAVGVPPNERRSGIGGAMMTKGLRLMKEAGFQFASLYAYREPYYRKFGYECCGSAYEIRCPQDRLPKTRSKLKVRQLAPAEFEAIREPYRVFAHRYSGMNTRENERFWPNAEADPPWTVYAAGDPIEAYVIVRLDPTFWTEQQVREFVWLTPEGYNALMELFQGFAINKTAVRWSEPGDSPFQAVYMDQGVEAKREHPVMFRALDVPGLLRGLKPTEEGSFLLAVRDELMPENDGTWKVSFTPNQVEVAHCDEQPDIAMDVRQFAQAFLGEPSLSELLRLGLARGGRSEPADAACRLLPPSSTTCIESF